jgi:hypothetical protein
MKKDNHERHERTRNAAKPPRELPFSCHFVPFVVDI